MADESSSSSSTFLQRVRLILRQRHLRDAMRVLNDETHDGDMPPDRLLALDVFRHLLNTAVVLALQDAGGNVDEQQISQDFPRLAMQALRQTRDLLYEQLERSLSQAGAAAVHSLVLEKQTFRAAAGGDGDDGDGGVTECRICLVEFVAGEQVSVVPCPSHEHKFHPDCIAKWLEMRSTCPLCRHELPIAAGVLVRAYDQ